MKKRIIAIGSDHAAFSMKREIIALLEKMEYAVIDYGSFSEDSVDYPDIAHPVGKAINEGKYEFGIVLCGSGIGVSMVVNKYPNVRCALCNTVDAAKTTRQHNNANILAIGARVTDSATALSMVQAFLSTEFEGGRHEKRVAKIAIS